MSTIGIDLEQFVRDPYATGIQRVLQQLAIHWPDHVGAEFVIPNDDGTFTLLTKQQAAELLSLPFSAHQQSSATNDANHELRLNVQAAVSAFRMDRAVPKVSHGELVSVYDGWLLPEVSYLPAVLQRLELFRACMPTTMIGYDALPMTQPGNYRFVPGMGSWASEYFRLLASVDSVVCISDWTRQQILDRLRRDRTLVTTVAHPGGDHIEVRARATANAIPRFLRVGTMEARKRPIEILRAFTTAIDQGVQAELMYVGNPNSSSQSVNEEVLGAIAQGYPVTWIQGASDAEVYEHMSAADVFLSIGVEGFGIPVLEAIRLGTPVVFNGVQPAGELMRAKGAQQLEQADEAGLLAAFHDFANGEQRERLTLELEPLSVPTWRAFALGVANVATSHAG